MNHLEFYKHLETVVGRKLTDLEADMLDITCAPPHHIAERVLKNEPEEWDEGRYPIFVHLKDVEEHYKKGKYGWWLYDKTSKIWITNIESGSHVVMAGMLYQIFKNSDRYINSDESADLYIEEHMGFFVSASMRMYIPIKADDYVLTEEEAIFEKAKGSLKWRGID